MRHSRSTCSLAHDQNLPNISGKSRRGDRTHYEKELARGKVTCNCYNYSSIEICAHSVVAAENLGYLKSFFSGGNDAAQRSQTLPTRFRQMHQKELVRRMAIPTPYEEGEQCGEQLSMTMRKKGLPVFLQSLSLVLYLLCKAECLQKYTRTKTHLS